MCDPIPTQVAVTYSRVEGIVAGQGASPNKTCTVAMSDVLTVASQGDLEDIIGAVAPSTRLDWLNMNETELHTADTARMHCTAMIRLTPNMSELYAGQNMWWDYSAMNRIFKTYTYEDPLAPGQDMSVQFSSYPGVCAIPLSLRLWRLPARDYSYFCCATW